MRRVQTSYEVRECKRNAGLIWQIFCILSWISFHSLTCFCTFSRLSGPPVGSADASSPNPMGTRMTLRWYLKYKVFKISSEWFGAGIVMVAVKLKSLKRFHRFICRLLHVALSLKGETLMVVIHHGCYVIVSVLLHPALAPMRNLHSLSSRYHCL